MLLEPRMVRGALGMPNHIRRLLTSDEFLLGFLSGIAVTALFVLALRGRPTLGAATFAWLVAYILIVTNKMRER